LYLPFIIKIAGMVRLLSLLFAMAIVLPLSGQTILFQDDFNDCAALSSTWTVSIDGNQNFVWYVGTPKNPKCDSSSIDGTCMLVMDDDATGNNTPALTADFRTPVFDGRGFAMVLLEVDVHYRDLGNLDDYFEILLSDGTNERVLARYDNLNATGSQFSQHVSFSSDLSLYSQNENMQIIFRYSDAGGYAWWAGIDNVRITGIGEGSPVVVETFDSCALPAGWNAEVVTGDFNWFYTPPPSTRYGAGSSMNGSCFVLFDDDYIGQAAKPSLLRLASPWFDGSEFATYQLSFELIFRWYISEIFSVYVESDDGQRELIASWPSAVGGPAFSNFVRQSFDISRYRHKQMRIVFEYDDGGSWGWWVGIDNVKISGHGEAHDLCSNTIELPRNQSCIHGDNKTSIFEGPVPSCSEINYAGVWYRWVADTTGWMEVELNADFNDVVSIFSGDCDSLEWVVCGNRDKYGFKGEKTYFQAQSGTAYFLRVSGGTNEGFGSLRGDYCIRIYGSAPPPSEINDPCAGAIPLIIGNDCLPSRNLHATAQTPNPSRNLRADADVWYSFVAPDLNDDQILRIESNADFSDVLTLYEGSCESPVEIKGNEFGQRLDVDQLTSGQIYFLQVAGNFATIEGDFCVKAGVVQKDNKPANDDCLQAKPLFLDTDCTQGTLKGATFSGIHPPCIVSTKRDAWYSFVAPLDGGIQVIVEANFKQNSTVWSGTCNNLSAVKCLQNPIRCNGYQKVTGLIPGETYFLQISATGEEQGDFCVTLLDGLTSPPFDPLRLSVRTLCIGMDSSLLLLDAFNGLLPYTWSGTPNQQLLYTGEEYNVVVKDAMGCEQAISGVAPECNAAVSCAMDIQFTSTAPTCANSNDGSLSVEVNNGNDPYLYAWSIPGQITNTVDQLNGGIYSVTVYDESGCTATGSVTLQAPPPISISILEIVNPTGSENNGSIEASFTGGTGELTVTWYDKDGLLLSNSSSLAAVGSGQYTIVVSDANGCSASQTVSLEVTSVDKPEKKEDLVQILPNPAKGKAFILIQKDLRGRCDIQISDPSGRRVQDMQNVEVQQGQIALDIRALPAGTYFVRIDIDRKIFTKRLLVIRN
jgi:hypothetical protein